MVDELESFRERATAWLSVNARPLRWEDEPVIGLIREIHTADEVQQVREWNQAKFDGGWAGITWPRHYGGQARSAAAQLAWKQEVSRFDTAEEGCVVGPALAGPIILEHGSPEQRDRYLRAILRGTHIWCQLFSEPEAGSDLASLSTAAQPDGDGWLVNGHKIWSSVAQFADRGLLLARTDGSVAKHRGITCFALDMRTPGITVRPIVQMNGQQTFNEVFLDDVRIPDGDRIGDVGNGWRIAMNTLTAERLDLGLRRGVNVPRLLRLATDTTVDGVPAADVPAYRDRLVDVCVRVESLRALGRDAVLRAMAGQAPGPHGSIAKLVGAQLMNDAANLALDIQGPLGMIAGDDAPENGVWQHGFLSSPARRIGGGTDEIQRNIIAERHLGMPREPA